MKPGNYRLLAACVDLRLVRGLSDVDRAEVLGAQAEVLDALNARRSTRARRPFALARANAEAAKQIRIWGRVEVPEAVWRAYCRAKVVR